MPRRSSRGQSRANHQEMLKIDVAERIPTQCYGISAGTRHPLNLSSASFFRRMLCHYKSIIPRFNPIVTACVRSLAPSLARMFLTWLFTVTSVSDSCLRGDLLH
jgi:hypothetical protein